MKQFLITNSRKIVFVILVLAVVVLTYRELTRESPKPERQVVGQALEVPIVISIPRYVVQFSADSTKPPATFEIRFVSSEDTLAAKKAGWEVGQIADKERDLWAVSLQVK